MYRLIIEHIVKQVLREVSKPTKAKQELLSSKEHGSKFLPLSDPYRVGNPGNITDGDFKEILKSVFKIDDKDIKPIQPGPNSPSSKFISYRFPYEGKMATLILAGKGKEEKERQERGLIEAINSIEGEKTLIFNNTKIEGVKSAKKIGKVEGYKAQAYADIELDTTKGIKKISAKGLQAPTLGSGGLSGLDILNNTTANSFIERVYREVAEEYQQIINANPNLKGQNLRGNKLFRDVYRQIPKEVEIPIIRGTKEMGGPIDYLYIGKMEVDFQVKGNTISFNGDLYTVEEFVEKGTPLYVRITQRKDGPCYFTTEKNPNLQNIDVPKVFSIKPNGSGGTQSRLFVTNRATKGRDY